MSNKIYDQKMVQYTFEINERLGIPEEKTALAIAKDFGKEKELEEALKGRKKSWSYRQSAEDVPSILERICRVTPKTLSVPMQGNYVLMPTTSTYALGVYALRDAFKKEPSNHPSLNYTTGDTLCRPLTFKETIEARVHDYESNKHSDERLRLFQKWNDSCTGVAYKKGTSKFKIVPRSLVLITIPEEFKGEYLTVKYDSMDGEELDSTKAVYNNLLTLKQIETHPAWLAALEVIFIY